MTLSTEQSILVATKVWGMDFHALKDWYEAEKHDLNESGLRFFPVSFNDWLSEKTNSWQGFGRTVEAMAEKKWFLSLEFDDVRQEDCLCFSNHKGNISRVSESMNNGWRMEFPQTLVKATHLAALEAIMKRNNESDPRESKK